MATSGPYVVSVQAATPRGIAGVRARLNISRVPGVFRTYLDRVYAAARQQALQLDGQNIFLYESVPATAGDVDVTFGVGSPNPFPPTDGITYVTLPVGTVATTTHRGPYTALGDAHAAVIDWCRGQGHVLTGTRWEVYGHWSPDEPPRTDVFHLLV